MLKKILQYILMTCLLAPLVLDLRFYQPYVASKYYFLLTLILLSAPLVIYFIFQRQDIWRSSLVRITLIFFAEIAAINLFSADWSRSWWGDWQRMQGLFYWELWLLFFLGLILAFQTKPDWLKLMRLNQLVVVTILLFGFGQMFNWLWFEDAEATRIYSLMGNANFLAHYLLLSFWLSLAMVYFDRRWRRFHLPVSLLILPIIYQTASRGAFLSLLLPLLVLMLYYLVRSWSKNKIISLSAIFALISLVLLTYPFLSPRFKNYSLADITTEARLVAWQAGLAGWQDKPILGWGNANYQIVFNKYVDFKIYRDDNSRLWYDKAHNQFIDFLVESGILGLLFYLIFLLWPASVLPAISRPSGPSLGVEDRHQPILSWLLGLGLVSNFIFLFFNFDTPISWLVYFVYLGLLHHLSRSHDKIEDGRLDSSLRPALVMVAGLTLLGLFYLVIQPVRANLEMKKIFLAPQRHYGLAEIRQMSDEVKRYAPQYQPDLALTLANALNQMPYVQRQQVDAMAYLQSEAQSAAQRHLLDAKLHFLVANTYLRLGQLTGAKQALEQARDYYEKVLPFLTDGRRPDLIYNLAQTYYELALLDQDQAADYINTAKNLLQENAARFPLNQQAQDKLKVFLSIVE